MGKIIKLLTDYLQNAISSILLLNETKPPDASTLKYVIQKIKTVV